jgi:hypothetical protein
MKLRPFAANAAVVAIALVIGLVLCEIGARLFLNAADYLSVTTRADDVLGITIAPNTSGLDGWGFRNPAVPKSADIVALGDSHTFGNTATMTDAWPSVVSHETGQTVYNLGLGGYGPNQYYHLLTTRGLSLHPKWVICGLYMGDDFENAYSITYGLDHWASLRTGDRKKVNADIWEDSGPPGAFRDVRNWLSRESVVYRLVVHGPVLGAFKEGVRFSRASRGADPEVTVLEIPDRKIREAFRPLSIASRLDQGRDEVREGMRITFHLLQKMNEACRANGCSFGVVIIPTKETVFASELQAKPGLPLKDALNRVISNERVARSELGAFLDQQRIPYVDTLPPLRRAIGDELYARTTADMHPGRNGYRVIAAEVSGFLRQHETRPK